MHPFRSHSNHPQFGLDHVLFPEIFNFTVHIPLQESYSAISRTQDIHNVVVLCYNYGTYLKWNIRVYPDVHIPSCTTGFYGGLKTLPKTPI